MPVHSFSPAQFCYVCKIVFYCRVENSPQFLFVLMVAGLEYPVSFIRDHFKILMCKVRQNYYHYGNVRGSFDSLELDII